jgi:hypothetical protein
MSATHHTDATSFSAAACDVCFALYGIELIAPGAYAFGGFVRLRACLKPVLLTHVQKMPCMFRCQVIDPLRKG